MDDQPKPNGTTTAVYFRCPQCARPWGTCPCPEHNAPEAAPYRDMINNADAVLRGYNRLNGELEGQMEAMRATARALHRRTQTAESKAERRNRRLKRDLNLYRDLYSAETDTTKALRTRCAELEAKVKELEARDPFDVVMSDLQKATGKMPVEEVMARIRQEEAKQNAQTRVARENWNPVTPDTLTHLRGKTVLVKHDFPPRFTQARAHEDGFYTMQGVRLTGVTQWKEWGEPHEKAPGPKQEADGWHRVTPQLWPLARGASLYVRINPEAAWNGPREELARVGQDGLYTQIGRYIPFEDVTHVREA